MIMTAKEAIAYLEQAYGNAMDETLCITWWDSKDFEGRDVETALRVADDQMDVCIGHVNDIVGEFAPVEEEEA